MQLIRQVQRLMSVPKDILTHIKARNKLYCIMKKNLLIALLTLITTFGAFAQTNDKPKVAFCQLPKGCVFYDHPFTYKQLDLMFDYLGTYENKKGILTFVTNVIGERMNF